MDNNCFRRVENFILLNKAYNSVLEKYFPFFISRRLFIMLSISLLILQQWILSLFKNFSFNESKITSYKILCLLERIGIKFQIEGLTVLENIKPPVIFVSNHMSVLETLILPGLINSFFNVTFVVKEELFHYPFFKKLLHSINAIPVTRKSPINDYKTMISKSEFLFSSKISLLIFPKKLVRLNSMNHLLIVLGQN